tara:strand:- start:2114 stop:2635 length:522 start_codon:yes stop_codon:yes gene_type:complete
MDSYSSIFSTALDVVIRRVGWRLSGEKLNPMGFALRNKLKLETWGQRNGQPLMELRDITERSAGGIHNLADYNRHLDFFILSLEFYEQENIEPHVFDKLLPTLQENDHQLNFFDNTFNFLDVVMEDSKNAHDWRLAPKLIAAQECDMGRNLRDFGFIPGLEFTETERYITAVC